MLYLCFLLWTPLRNLLLYKAFLWLVLTCASLGWFSFLSVAKLKRLHRAASRAISCCLSSFPVALLSEASLPSLRVTLTHFTPSSYKRVLCLSTPFSILGLARLLHHEVTISARTLTLVSTIFFSRTGGVLSHLNALTHRFPRFPPRNLCARFCCNGHSLLLSFCLCRICRIEDLSWSAYGHPSRTPLISFYIVQLRTLALLTYWRLPVSLRPLVQALGSCPASGTPWFSAKRPSLGRDRVAITIEKHQFNVGVGHA